MAQQDRERGERIAELRKAAGYTSADKLASALDVNYRSVQNWEAGKGISEDNVKDLADLLQVTREFILYGAAETPDLMSAVNGDVQAQLDRIERKLNELLRRQAGTSADESGETTRQPTPLRRRRNPQAPRGPRKKAGGS
jgi:transcriptional regulator with XRE-family HTH domain